MGWFPCCCGQCETCLTYYTDFVSGTGIEYGPLGLPTGWKTDVSAIESAGTIEVGNGFVNFYGTDYGAWISNYGPSGLADIPTGSTGNVQISSNFVLHNYGVFFGYNMHYDENKQRRYEFRDDALYVWDNLGYLKLLAVKEYNASKTISSKNMRVSFCFDDTELSGSGATKINLWNQLNDTDIYLDTYIDPWKVGDTSDVAGGYAGADIGAAGTGEYLPPLPPFRNSGEIVWGQLHGTLYDYYIYDNDIEENCCPCTGLDDFTLNFSGCSTCISQTLDFTVTGFRCQLSSDFCNSDPLCDFMQGYTFEDIPFAYIDYGVGIVRCGRCVFNKDFPKTETGLPNNITVRIEIGCGQISTFLIVDIDYIWPNTFIFADNLIFGELDNICISGQEKQLPPSVAATFTNSCPYSFFTTTGYLQVH